jgi:PTS system nitrogen regulatory IIA component
MNLGVRDAAALLKVSEKTIYRWISSGKLPAYRVQDQYRFNRVELLEWATSRRLNVSHDIFTEPREGVSLPSLAGALQAGGLHYRVEGKNREEVLRAIVEQIRMPEEVDRDFLFRVLLAREELGSTGVGDGIAIPHVRNPVVLHVSQPTISLSFLEQPVDFNALDGKPVQALFTIISPTVRAHLHMLSRLAFALRDDEFKAGIQRQALREELLAIITRIENGFPEETKPNSKADQK